MTTRRLGLWLATGVVALAGSAALAAGDPAAGEKVFTSKCKVCHVADAEKKKVGPSLYHVFGRQAGTLKGFKYSEAMKKSGITWTEETLDAYLADPKGYVKGNRMTFLGLRQEQDRADVIAYLKQITE
jgi:cytochrome c